MVLNFIKIKYNKYNILNECHSVFLKDLLLGKIKENNKI